MTIPAPSRRGRPRKPRPSLDWALDWYDRFGLDLTCISEQGRERFAWLLAEVQRLRRLLEDSSHA